MKLIDCLRVCAALVRYMHKFKNKFTQLLVIGLIVFSSNLYAQSANTKQLDELIEKTVKPNDPGVAVIVVKNGEIKYKRSRGVADLSAKTPITPKTPFYIASLSKQFTAVAIMMLAEQGKLKYDDKLIKYFPEFESFAPEITIRHILTHTSGLIDHLDVMEDKVTGWTNDDVVKLLKKENRVEFQPLDKFSYSNSGYVLLAMIVEKVSGMSFSKFLDKNMFQPLKMKNTFVLDRKEVKIPAKAKGYSLIDNKWKISDYDAFTVGAGGIYSTLEDLEKWDRSFYTKPLIKEETIKLASVPPTRNNGKPTPYGFGWLAEYAPKGDLANVWYVASSGNFKGFQSFMKRIPERHFSVIVLSNYGNFPWETVRLAEKLYATNDVAQSTKCTSATLSVRNGHRLTYDSNRKKTVLFGGADASQVLGDLWEWNGKKWICLNSTPTLARTFPAMAYDIYRKEIVLFGGNRVLFGKGDETNTLLGDTWEWNGKEWSKIDVEGPTARSEPAMVYDSKRNRMVLFGGYFRKDGKNDRLGDTWEFDGQKWLQVSTTGPTPRSGSAMVFDDDRKKIVGSREV